MKKASALAMLVLLAAGGVGAQQVVNQGAPGKQGPWPVSIQGASVSISLALDGGFIGTVQTQPCTTLKSSNTSVGTSAIPVPATPLTSRVWVQLCNSPANSQSTQCVCAPDTCGISVAASSVGDFLNPGDCALYNLGTQDAGVPCCICNAAGQRISGTECAL